MRLAVVAVVAGVLAVLVPAVPAAVAQEAAAENRVVELFLGLSRPDGGVVTEAEWSAFVDEVMAPALPGFAVTPCEGVYRSDAGQTVREGCKRVVTFVTAEQYPAVSAVVAAYNARFAQESVLRLERPCPATACRFE